MSHLPMNVTFTQKCHTCFIIQFMLIVFTDIWTELSQLFHNSSRVYINLLKEYQAYRHLLTKVGQKQWRNRTQRVKMRWKREMVRKKGGTRWSGLKRNLKKSNSLLLNCAKNLVAFYTCTKLCGLKFSHALLQKLMYQWYIVPRPFCFCFI